MDIHGLDQLLNNRLLFCLFETLDSFDAFQTIQERIFADNKARCFGICEIALEIGDICIVLGDFIEEGCGRIIGFCGEAEQVAALHFGLGDGEAQIFHIMIGIIGRPRIDLGSQIEELAAEIIGVCEG